MPGSSAPDHTWRLELPDEPIEVVGDELRLHQVVTNLLTNARKHTPAGTTVTVAATPSRVQVHDDGPGFPPDLLPHAFERFARADQSRQRDGGAGLGLSMVQAIVRSHGGTVAPHERARRHDDHGAAPRIDSGIPSARLTPRLSDNLGDRCGAEGDSDDGTGDGHPHRPSRGEHSREEFERAEARTAHNYHPLPVVLAHAEGAWMTDVDGRRFLDLLAGYSALNFGHGHPRLRRRRARAARQADADQPGVRPRPVRRLLPPRSATCAARTWCCR